MYKEKGGNRVKVSKRSSRSLWLSLGMETTCIHAVVVQGAGSSYSPGGHADRSHLGGRSLLPLPEGGQKEEDGQLVTLNKGIPPGLFAL